MSFSVLKGPKGRIYLDHNATTPVSEAVAEQASLDLCHWGNPSSIHWGGRGPKALIRDARKRLAAALGASPLELVFTSGGSESNNMALMGLFDYVMAHRDTARGEEASEKPFRLIISSVEHPSVTETAEYLRSKGAQVERLPVSRQGEIDLELYHRLLEEPTDLVSVMMANNETGTIFPIAKLCEMAHQKGAFFHTDAVQALGKLPVNLAELGVDYASFSGHKFYALKGAGLLYCKKGRPQLPLIHGGRQERARRAGTENTLAISSLGTMAPWLEKLPRYAQQVSELRDYMETEILKLIQGTQINARGADRLPNTSSLLLSDVDGESLLMALDVKGFAVSTGAACSSGSQEPSPVLLAMGLSRFEAQSSLRLSLGWENSREEIDLFIHTLAETVHRLRSIRHEERA